VRPFLFHAYSPTWEVPLDFSAKEYGMYCVGNNCFGGGQMHRVLKAIEPVREQVGPSAGRERLELAGAWIHPKLGIDAYYTIRTTGEVGGGGDAAVHSASDPSA